MRGRCFLWVLGTTLIGCSTDAPPPDEEPEATTTGDISETTGGTAPDTTESSGAPPPGSSSDAGSTTGSSTEGGGESSTGSAGFCGDESLDPGEDCDDGNDVNGDGCNDDCTISGSELWMLSWDAETRDVDLAMDAYDHLLVAIEPEIHCMNTSGTIHWTHDVDDHLSKIEWGPDSGAYALVGFSVDLRRLDSSGDELWNVSTHMWANGGPPELAIDPQGRARALRHRYFNGSPTEVELHEYALADGADSIVEYPVPRGTSIENLEIADDGAFIIATLFEGALEIQRWPADLTAATWMHDTGFDPDIAEIARIRSIPGGGLAYTGRLRYTDPYRVEGFAVVLDGDGDVLWSDIRDDARYEDIAVDSQGAVVAVGRREHYDLDQDHLMAKFDAEGSLLWEYEFDPEGDLNSTYEDGFDAVEIDSEDRIYTLAIVNGGAEVWLQSWSP